MAPYRHVEDDLGVGDEEETEDLLTLDAKEWKVGIYFESIIEVVLITRFLIQKQDHYAVLGLSHLRYKATDEQIKIARGCLVMFLSTGIFYTHLLHIGRPEKGAQASP